jgi:hypothetical protein
MLHRIPRQQREGVCNLMIANDLNAAVGMPELVLIL